MSERTTEIIPERKPAREDPIWDEIEDCKVIEFELEAAPRPRLHIRFPRGGPSARAVVAITALSVLGITVWLAGPSQAYLSVVAVFALARCTEPTDEATANKGPPHSSSIEFDDHTACAGQA